MSARAYTSPPAFPWDEHIPALRRFWADGLSCSEIARELSRVAKRPCTRNAVISKVNRLGLPPRRPTTRRPGQGGPSRPRPVRGARPQASLGVGDPPNVRAMQTALERALAPETALAAVIAGGPKGASGVRLLDLKPRQCRWPLQDLPARMSPSARAVVQRFCGAGCEEGSSWCSAHRRIAYRPADHRWRDLQPPRARHARERALVAMGGHR
jgi:hypothetical protein